MVQDIVVKEQRIRDPIHDLIVFRAENEFEQLIWRLLNAKEFQRLRRIKQLGFSELVYPGATHTRFAHSIGVFHSARELVQLLKRLLGNTFSQVRADVAVCAALLHDLGHGPFSHAFEGVVKKRQDAKKHEKWTVEIIRGDTDIATILSEYGEKHSISLQDQVAELLDEDFPSDIYSSVVSSQFDADRLDYLRRDKLMTGTQHGGFDWSWLFNNLDIETLTIGGDGDRGNSDHIEAPGFVVGSKAQRAAEGYLLGRFHLYTQVYMHKTTRGAEKMLGALLARTSELIVSGDELKTNLPVDHPIRVFFGSNGVTLQHFIALDDTTVWGALPLFEDSKDELVKELSGRLRHRRLYKCLDVGAKALGKRGDAVARFQKRLKEAQEDGVLTEADVLADRTKVSAYEFREFESKDAFEKIVIRRPSDASSFDDIEKVSEVVKAIGVQNIFRVYARNEEVMSNLLEIWKEASR